MLGITKNIGDMDIQIEKGSEVDGAREAKVVLRCFGKGKGRKEKIILILFCKEGKRKRRNWKFCKDCWGAGRRERLEDDILGQDWEHKSAGHEALISNTALGDGGMGTTLSPCTMCDICNKGKHIAIHLVVDAKSWKPRTQQTSWQT